MADLFAVRDRPPVKAAYTPEQNVNSTRVFNSLSANEVATLSRNLGRPVLNDSDVREASAKIVRAKTDDVSRQATAAVPATVPNPPAQTPTQVAQAAEDADLSLKGKTKALCAQMSLGCDAMPFGPVCSMCSRFPNESAYFALLNDGLNKLANAVNFRKVWGGALENLDFSLIKKLGMCALNISKAATAAVNVAGMAYAAAGDPRAVEALCFVVLQRGGWMEPLDFMDDLIANMDATLENAELVAAICSSLSFDTGNLYKSLIAGLFYRCPVYDLRKINQMTFRGMTVGNYYMGEEKRKRALAIRASVFMDPLRSRLDGSAYSNW